MSIFKTSSVSLTQRKRNNLKNIAAEKDFEKSKIFKHIIIQMN